MPIEDQWACFTLASDRYGDKRTFKGYFTTHDEQNIEPEVVLPRKRTINDSILLIKQRSVRALAQKDFELEDSIEDEPELAAPGICYDSDDDDDDFEKMQKLQEIHRDLILGQNL
jgi:hypothetical protein